jgi:hypothetical protein
MAKKNMQQHIKKVSDLTDEILTVGDKPKLDRAVVNDANDIVDRLKEHKIDKVSADFIDYLEGDSRNVDLLNTNVLDTMDDNFKVTGPIPQEEINAVRGLHQKCVQTEQAISSFIQGTTNLSDLPAVHDHLTEITFANSTLKVHAEATIKQMELINENHAAQTKAA